MPGGWGRENEGQGLPCPQKKGIQLGDIKKLSGHVEGQPLKVILQKIIS
ncbi:hypothetical protein [Desulfonatronum thioautotrophicum]|nr:hypothetical protein [Desulfonatronum thioautotrophicum]